MNNIQCTMHNVKQVYTSMNKKTKSAVIKKHGQLNTFPNLTGQI